MTIKKYLLPLTLIFLLLSFSFSEATIRFVSHTGSSTPPYTTWETAADSIMKCIAICEFGDTIYVANGVYQERIDMIPGLTLVGAGMDSCIINSSQVTNPPGTYSIRVTDSCYLAGFQFIPSTNASQGIGVYIYDINIENIYAIVKENKIVNGAYGFRISSSSLGTDYKYKLIEKNVITSVENGILSIQTKPTISENYVYANVVGMASGIYSYPTYLNNTIYMDSPQTVAGLGRGFSIITIIKNNAFFIYDFGGNGIGETGDSIINNVVTGNLNIGITTYNGGTIINNIIKGAQIGIDHDGTTPVPKFQYNNLWNNDLNYKDITPDSTNIYHDPMFVNEDSLDLHLQKYSPLIDAGDPNILDVDGTRSDIGMYGGPFGESYEYLDLPPKPPVNLTATVEKGFIELNWKRNTEADTNHYNVYRDTVSNFTIDITKLISSQTDTFYIQPVSQEVESLYYKITAVDNQNNESKVSEEAGILITSVKGEWKPLINGYSLSYNYPNPFNPSTMINYKLKERGYVKLMVYDIKGELVQVLVNEVKEAGYYEVEFSVPDTKELASGIYIYQIMVRNENNIPLFTDIGKMILLK